MVLESFESIIVIFLLIGAGMLIAGLKWVSRDMANALSKIVINLGVPGTLIYNFTQYFTRRQLTEMWLPLLIIFLIVPTCFFVGKLVARLFRIQKSRRGVFTVLFSLSNSMFIGFPVAQALFGQQGMPYAVLYYFANTTVFWTLGYLVIKSDADVIMGRKDRVCFKQIAKKLLTPPIITVVVMFGVIIADIKLPSVVLKTAEYLGGLTTPLSLIFTGCMVYFIGFSGIKVEKDTLLVIAGRFVIIPALCFGICTVAIALMPQQTSFNIMRNVYTVQIGLPAMMQTTILAELYGADVEYATKNVVITTLLMLVFIPIYMAVLPG